jgi:hypothetical protein
MLKGRRGLLKKIVNSDEEVAYRELQSLAREYGYNVHLKVRLADVLSIDGSGVSEALYSYALKSHFDFVVCDEHHDPAFVVEFDGPSHHDSKQRDRDYKKNALCERFELPLLRINTNHLIRRYNRASLLRWIISAWELQKSFYEAQERGQIPADEDFDPIFLWHPGKTMEEIHPHRIALKSRLRIEELHKRGRLRAGHTCQLTFRDDNDNYHGIEWIDVGEGKVVAVESAMREQLFPIYLGDLFCELMTVLLYEKLMSFLASQKGAIEPSEVADRLRELQQRYRFAASHMGPTQVNGSISFPSVLRE